MVERLLIRWGREKGEINRERKREKGSREESKRGEREWECLSEFGDLAEGAKSQVGATYTYKTYVYIVLQWCSVDCCW